MISHSRPHIVDRDVEAVVEVIRSGMIAEGPSVGQFEKAVARFVGASTVFALASGKAALGAALRAAGVRSCDEVVLPTYVCRDVVTSVLAVGAHPVFCDVDDGWVISPEAAKDSKTNRTAAIVAIHTFGMRANLAALGSLDIPIIEDASHAFRPLNDAPPNTITVFSFQATKCLATGEGGAIAFRSLHQADCLSKDLVSKAAPLSDIAAALGSSQLDRYAEMTARRKELADRYFSELPSALTRRLSDHAGSDVLFRFPLTLSQTDLDETVREYGERGIQVRRPVAELAHRRFGLSDDRFPNAVTRFQETLSLPLYPALSDEDQSHIIETTNRTYEHSHAVPEAW